jgi:flagellar M-ring protein FliF
MAKIELIDQAKSFYEKLSKKQRAIILGAVGIVVVGITALLLSTGEKKEYSVLFSELDPKEAGKIVEELKKENKEFKLEDEGKTILVEKKAVHETRLNMAKEGLPEQGGVGYEIFDKTNLGMSEFVQKLNYRRALEGELSRTISSLNEVKKAIVHIVIPENTLFEKDQKQPSASVTLHFKNNGKSLDNVSVVGIQNLVASSVQGMQPAAVTVVDYRGKILSAAPLDEKSVAGLTGKQFEQQVNVEQNITNKVQSLLDGALGYGNSEVRVSCELDFTQVDKTITDFDPEKQVVRSEQNIVENSKSSDSLSYPAVNMQKDQSNQIANYEISKSVQRVIEGVGNIKRLTVAVMINGTQKLIEKDGIKSYQYVPRNQNELNQLEEIVKNAVGYDITRNDQITVKNVPFETQLQNDDLKELNKPVWYKDPENIKLIALVLVMLFIIFMIYRLLQSKVIKNRFRIAFALPEKVKIEEEEEEEDVEEEELEEIEFDDDDLLLLPAELPEQLLLEGERSDMSLDEYSDDDDDSDFDLAGGASASLDGAAELTEEALMKLEIKNKVEDYIGADTQEAVRLVRILLAQDLSL